MTRRRQFLESLAAFPIVSNIGLDNTIYMQSGGENKLINYGETVSGELDTADQTGYYGYYDPITFEGTAGDVVTITMRSDGDPRLILIDPNGAEVTSNDDGANVSDFNSRISSYQLQSSGEYTIIATSYSEEATFQYELSLEINEEKMQSEDGKNKMIGIVAGVFFAGIGSLVLYRRRNGDNSSQPAGQQPDELPDKSPESPTTSGDAAKTTPVDTQENSGESTIFTEKQADQTDNNSNEEKTPTEQTDDEIRFNIDSSLTGTEAISAILDQVSVEEVEADEVRALASALETASATDRVIDVLETWSQSDDEEVRLAVCQACANIDSKDTEPILKPLRIDENTRVATAAIEAM